MSGMTTMQSSFTSVFKPPRIRRKHLRKYSWLPDVLRLKGSVRSSIVVVPRIIGPVLTVTLFATGIAYASHKGYKLIVTNSVVPLLSVVVGLILVFRTSYDRYWEGRKSFASLTSGVRNLSRVIWINVAPPPTDTPPSHTKGKTPSSDITEAQLTRRKIDALHMCVLFVFSVKHYLRGEDGLQWDDYSGVIPPSFARLMQRIAPTSYQSTIPYGEDWSRRISPEGTVIGDATKRVRAKRSKSHMPGSSTPLLGDNDHQTLNFQPEASMPLPLIIVHELNRMIFLFRRDGLLETVGPAGANAMSQIIQNMVEQLTAMERVANTPIPISYGIHLKQCVTLYLFSLPLTLVHDLGWMSIPITTVVAFTFMGIEGIADEIEMPFGTDSSDLPLDRYCQDLKEEIQYTIEKLPTVKEGSHGYDDGEGDD